MAKSKKKFYFLIIGIGAAAFFLFLFLGGLKNFKEVKIKYKREGAQRKEVSVTRRFDGTTVVLTPSASGGADGAADILESLIYETENPPLVAIVIDNHVDARPISGLSQAGAVYEIPVEGNITRFMALYSLDQLPSRVGPIRSARSYFLDYLSEWGKPLFLHVGGSPTALVKLKFGYNHLDENTENFFRDKKRIAPHNTYTGKDLLEPIFGTKVTSTPYTSLVFETEPETAGRALLRADMVYALGAHSISWVWDENASVFKRMQAGQIHRDASGDEIAAQNVVIISANAKVLDSEGRLGLETIGSGKAWVMKSGNYMEVVWEKGGPEDRTRFKDLNGAEIKLKPGKTWFQIIKDTTSIYFVPKS